MSSGTERIVVLANWDDAEIARAFEDADIVCVAGTATVLTRSESGDIDEWNPNEHDAYVEIGTVHGRPALPDEEDLDDDDFQQGELGRIGTVYYQYDKHLHSWEWCGELGSDEDAIEYVSGADFYVQRNT